MQYAIEVNGVEVERHALMTAAYKRAEELRRVHGDHAVWVRDIPESYRPGKGV